MKRLLTLVLMFSLAGSVASATELNLVCDQRLLKELNQLIEEYVCIKQQSGECEQVETKTETPSRRKINSRDIRKASTNSMRKISEYLRKNSITSVNGVGTAAKFVFRKLGGFYLDSIMNSDPTADACQSEEHAYKTKPGDTVDVSRFIHVGVPSGTYRCQMAFNIEGNNGVGNFFDLPNDKDRLKVLKNKTACTYYYGIREHLEDEIFKHQKGAAIKTKGPKAIR